YEQHASADKEFDEKDFGRFIEAQTVWDGAMAQALHAAASSAKNPFVVGIMGSGHLFRGYGVPHQLASLGANQVRVALPWDQHEACDELTADVADLVFGLNAAEEAQAAAERPKLGVMIEDKDGAVKIAKVINDSIADETGLKVGDVIVEAAGTVITDNGAFIQIVRRQAPGTWLPLQVRRDGKEIDFVAKFPSQK
ncbi:MAG: ChaN family lipoprotein, partial [Rhodospirillales bacterium]|nr:ChaN family lipoprotein [Rhodospirillales bacterium]